MSKVCPVCSHDNSAEEHCGGAWHHEEPPAPKLTIMLFKGDGDWFTYVDCVIDHQLSPDLTFTGRLLGHANRKKRVTTLPYIIETDIEETNDV